MLNPQIHNNLASKYPTELVDALLNSFEEVLTNYRIEKWKPSELDAGHFVEAVRRIIEFELTGSYTPLSTSLGSFNQAVLNRLESTPAVDEVYRILIPRALYAMYCIRNKRGVGHFSSISPNKLDATYILYSAKWILAELVRICSSSDPDEAYQICNAILERELDLVWDDGESFVILNAKIKAEQKVLIVLYKKDRIGIEELQGLVDYKNKTNFAKIVRKLKASKMLDVVSGGLCKLSPLGIKEAENIIQNT